MSNITTSPVSLLPAEMIVGILGEHASSTSLKEGSHHLRLRSVCREWCCAVDTSARMMYRELLKNLPSGLIPLKEVLRDYYDPASETEPKRILLPAEGPGAVKEISQKIAAAARRNGVMLPSHTVCLNRAQLEEIQAKAQEQDVALQLVWSSKLRHSVSNLLIFPPIQDPIPLADAPAPTIRAFLENSPHAAHLHKISWLYLDKTPDFIRVLKVVPSEIRLLKGLQTLDCYRSQIREAPDVSQNPDLIMLVLSDTPIQEAPNVRENPALLLLLLDDTQIREVPDISQNPALEGLELSHTQIREAPDIRENPKLKWLHLDGAPLMFVNDLVLTKFAQEPYVKLFLEQREYPCVSPLAHLYQHIICLRDEAQVVEAFHDLPQEDKNLIYEMVWEEAETPRTEDAQWGENHVFDKMRRFHYAVQRAIFAKRDRLSEEQKNRVYGQIYALAHRPKTTDAQWGEHHAQENLPRLADALFTL